MLGCLQGALYPVQLRLIQLHVSGVPLLLSYGEKCKAHCPFAA
jgi:hypothetical protein